MRLPNGFSFGQFRRANVSLITATGSDDASARSDKTRPRRTEMRRDSNAHVVIDVRCADGSEPRGTIRPTTPYVPWSTPIAAVSGGDDVTPAPDTPGIAFARSTSGAAKRARASCVAVHCQANIIAPTTWSVRYPRSWLSTETKLR